MAVETVILRPNSSQQTSSISWYPEYPDISADQIHTLVSEEVADDDATYIYASGTSYIPFLGFNFTGYTNKTPSAIRIVLRAKTINTNQSIQLFGDSNAFESSSDAIYGEFSLLEAYETYVCNISNEQLSQFWNAVIHPEEYEYTIGFGVKVDTSSKDGAETKISVTQLYLEVDFDNTQIYLKQNGTYAPVSQAYQKVDGTWTAIGMSDCAPLLSGTDVTKIMGIVPDIITFTISGTEYQAYEGMTWHEWIGSGYNTDGFNCDDAANSAVMDKYYESVMYNNVVCIASDLIIDGGTYVIE